MAITTGANVPQVSAEELQAAMEKRLAKNGRPSKYSADLAVEIAERLASGEPLKEICKAKKMPHFVTVYEWMGKIPEFGNLIAQARVLWSHAAADDAVTILDSVDGKAKDNQVRKAEARARIRLELAAKYNFAVFGEKKQNVNLNLNADVAPVDLAAYLNR